MNIEQTYAKLSKSKLDFTVFDEVNKLRNESKLNNNLEYYFLASLLLMQIYLNEQQLDECLQLALKTYNEILGKDYPKIFLSVIENIIYIYIEKQNYSSAYRYANEKRLLIDPQDHATVNRWYLEMAYIHEALSEKDRATTLLKAILENNPDDETKTIVLGNICRVLIDNQKYDEAKTYLEQSLRLVYQLKDKMGIRYCEYLNALIFEGEGKFKFSYRIYHDMFKGKVQLTNEFFNYLNGFLKLLLKMGNYDEAKKVCHRFMTDVKTSNDTKAKKTFYETYLLAIMYVANPKDRESLSEVVRTINILSSSLATKNEILSKEIKDDELTYELMSQEKAILRDIDTVTNELSKTSSNDDERDYLFRFAMSLEQIIPYNEALFVIFDRKKLDFLPEFYDDFHRVSTYTYRAKRLYHREVSYNDLNDSIIEMLVKGDKEVTIDFSETDLDLKDIFTKKSYLELKTKYLAAFTLEMDEDLFACVVYTASLFDITTKPILSALRIASKFVQNNLLSIFTAESLRFQKTVYNIASSSLKQGMFYLDQKKAKIILTDQFQNFIGTKDRQMMLENYNSLIVNQEVLEKRISAVSQDIAYEVEYYVQTFNGEVLVTEKGVPYRNNDETLFYVCTVNKITPSIFLQKINEKDKVLTKQDFIDDISNLKGYNLGAYYPKGLDDYPLSTKEYILKTIYLHIKNNVNEQTYILDNNLIITINSNPKAMKGCCQELAKGIEYHQSLLPVTISYCNVAIPNDLDNYADAFTYFNYIFSQNVHQTKYDSQLYTALIKQKEVDHCYLNAIDNDFSLLYAPLIYENELYGYYLNCNVLGLIDEEARDNTTLPVRISFEKLVLDKLVSENDKQWRFFMKIDPLTLQNIINNKYLNKYQPNQLDNIVFHIDRQADNLDFIIKRFGELGFTFYLSNEVFASLKIETIYLGYVKGIIDKAVDNRFLKVYRQSSFKLIVDSEIEYQYLITKTKHLLTADDRCN